MSLALGSPSPTTNRRCCSPAGLQRKKTDDMRFELQALIKERASLLRQINDLQSRPRTDMELRLSHAVSEATNAAAAAAEAAARAAGACVMQRRPAAAAYPPLPPPPAGALPPPGGSSA